MSKELVVFTKKYIEDVICSFELGLYRMVKKDSPDKMKYLSDKYQPFIRILRDLHQAYYTTTYESLVDQNDEYITKTYDSFKQLSNHSPKCVLTILGNLIVTVHFNLDRTKLKYHNRNKYIKTVKKEIKKTIPDGCIERLFEHQCNPNEKMEPLGEGENFITIDVSVSNTTKTTNDAPKIDIDKID